MGVVYHTLCNFHGSVTDIRTGGGLFRLDGVILPTGVRYASTGDLYVKLDVVETSSLHLKLPDRTEVVQDDAFKALIHESRIAMFEYLATLPAHSASYKQFLEAKEFGITLPEASPLLKDFYVPARDSHSTNLLPKRGDLIAHHRPEPSGFCRGHMRTGAHRLRL